MRCWRLPREHGFWVMLLGACCTAVLQAPERGVALGVALGCAVAAVVGAGALGRRVRQSAVAQLGSAVALGVIGLPAALLGGVDHAAAVVSSGAWVVVFAAGALLVRACFERARGRRGRALSLELGVAVATAGAAAVWGFVGWPRAALTDALGLGLALAVLTFRPSVKRLKRLGLALAAVTVLGVMVLTTG